MPDHTPPPCPVCGQPLDRSVMGTGHGVECEACGFELLPGDDEVEVAAEYVEHIRLQLPLHERTARVWARVLKWAGALEPREEDDDGD